MSERFARALTIAIMYVACVALVSILWWFAGWLGEPPALRLVWCVLLVVAWSTNPKLTFLSSEPARDRDTNLTE